MLRNKMKKVAVGAVAVAALTALGVGGVATSAQADVQVAGDVNWDIPTTPMTNVVTIGDQDYKVITTQTASNWVTAGPDWSGVSNSAQLSINLAPRGVDQPADVNDLDWYAQNSMAGIWASSANEVPNAYNWNYFYNLYAGTTEGQAAGAKAADMAIQNNGSSISADYGVYGGLRYRPEILWTDTLSSVQTGVDYIQKGEYYTSSGGDPVADSSGFAAPYDSEYGKTFPYAMGMSNGSGMSNPYSTVMVLHRMASACENIKNETKDYNGHVDPEDPTSETVNASNATWLTMNALPRTTRYEASEEYPMDANECALAMERVQKAAGWYVLSQINEGKVKKKKVAFVSTEFDESSNIVTINAFDCVDSYSAGSSQSQDGSSNNLQNNAGFAGVAGPYFDQLVAGNYSIVSDTFGGYAVRSNVTADDLASCDILFMTGVGSTNDTTEYTADEWKDWMVSKCSTKNNKDRAENDIQYCTIPPTQCNAKNFSVDKAIYGIHCLDYGYPELFPNMELLTYWYDCLYHIKAQNLKEVMQWTLAYTSLPDGTSLSSISDTYSIDDVLCKAAYGYEYYKSNGSKDEVISALKSNEGVITGNDFGTVAALDSEYNETDAEVPWADVYYVPSTEFEAWADDYVTKDTYKKFVGSNAGNGGNGGNGGGTKSTAKKQTIKAKAKVTVKGAKKTTVKVKNAKTKLAFKANKKTKKALKIKVKGKKKVIIKATKKAKKGKTYKVKVFAKASGSYAKSNVVKLKVKVK